MSLREQFRKEIKEEMGWLKIQIFNRNLKLFDLRKNKLNEKEKSE